MKFVNEIPFLYQSDIYYTYQYNLSMSPDVYLITTQVTVTYKLNDPVYSPGGHANTYKLHSYSGEQVKQSPGQQSVLRCVTSRAVMRMPEIPKALY